MIYKFKKMHYFLIIINIIISIINNSKQMINVPVTILKDNRYPILTEKKGESQKVLIYATNNIRILSIPNGDVSGDFTTGPNHDEKVGWLKIDEINSLAIAWTQEIAVYNIATNDNDKCYFSFDYSNQIDLENINSLNVIYDTVFFLITTLLHIFTFDLKLKNFKKSDTL